eukprot:jgi/Mesen1/10446/ME000082S09954
MLSWQQQPPRIDCQLSQRRQRQRRSRSGWKKKKKKDTVANNDNDDCEEKKDEAIWASALTGRPRINPELTGGPLQAEVVRARTPGAATRALQQPETLSRINTSAAVVVMTT